jgi:hypothetical protein
MKWRINMEYGDLLRILKHINSNIGSPELEEMISSILALEMAYPLKDDRLSCQEKIEHLILQRYGGR